MLKLLIVDDEPIILEGLCKTIDWERFGVEVVGTAVNGLDGLEKIRELSPDIVITDIRMNFMDGLELIKKSKEIHDDISFIILSAYNDFEYAKEACGLGAFSYVLKPFEEEQIISIICALKDRILRKKALDEKFEYMSNLLRDQEKEIEQGIIIGILKQNLTIEDINNKIRFLNTILSNDKEYVVTIIRINEIGTPKTYKDFKDKGIISFAVKKIIIEILGSEFQVSGVNLDDETIGILICLNSISVNIEARITELITRSLKTIKDRLGTMVFISKGSCYKGFDGIVKSYNEACKALELSYIIGSNNLLDIRDIGIKAETRYKYPSNIEYKILNSVRMSDLKNFKREFDNFVKFLENEDEFPAQIIFSLQCLFISIIRIFMESGAKWIDKYCEIEAFIGKMHQLTVDKAAQAIIGYVEEFIEFDFNTKYGIMRGIINDMIKVALSYIEKNISDSSLTIKTVADQVHLNAVYFGRLFKKELNVSFNEYITRLRIDLSKKLLTETDLKVYEVAQEVGIDNLSYFTVLFKKLIGITPIEFKKEVNNSCD